MDTGNRDAEPSDQDHHRIEHQSSSAHQEDLSPRLLAEDHAPRNETDSTGDYLCARCKELDINRLPPWDRYEVSEGITLPCVVLGSSSEISSDPECKLCQVFSRLCFWHQPDVGGFSELYILAQVPSLLALPRDISERVSRGDLRISQDYRDQTWFIILQRVRAISGNLSPSDTATCAGFLALYSLDQSEGFTYHVRSAMPTAIDYASLKEWIGFCITNHARCNGSTTGSIEPVPNLRVIDCATRKVVPYQTGQQYAALSYVWGKPTAVSSDSQDSDNLPADPPLTILDALTATLELGFRYIWIDKYCIPQQAEKEKAEQIRNMHKIYRNAEITIIAAAGEDHHYGLPGVSRTPRDPPPAVQVGSRRFLSTGQSLSRINRHSKWNSRGWTFQESLCSRRKLFFTNDQVFFECDGMDCQESIDKSLGPLYTDTSPLSDETNSGVFPSAIGKRPDDVWTQITQFTMRDLTYASDTLNAMLGIFEAFQLLFPGRFFHMWGLPIIIEPGLSLSDAITKSICRMVRGFGKLCRRSGFPSWSWTGWEGYEMHFFDVECCSTDVDIRVQMEDGRLIHDPEVLQTQHMTQAGHLQLMPILMVEAEVVELMIAECPSSSVYIGDQKVGPWDVFFEERDSDSGRVRRINSYDKFEYCEEIPGNDLIEELNAGRKWECILFPGNALVIRQFEGRNEIIGKVTI